MIDATISTAFGDDEDESDDVAAVADQLDKAVDEIPIINTNKGCESLTFSCYAVTLTYM